MYTAIYSIKNDKKNDRKLITFIIWPHATLVYRKKLVTVIKNRDFGDTPEHIQYYIADKANIYPSLPRSIDLIPVKEI